MHSYPQKSIHLISSFIVFILVLSQSAFAQQDIRFKRFSIEDGLSQSTVEAIVQDNLGFMWIGTEDGLNRFDGYTYKIYRNDPDDPGSISGNNIWCLHVDRNGLLWIGTYADGLNRFDPTTEIFTRYVHDPSNPRSISSNRIRSITEDHHGVLWIGTRDAGLNRMDRNPGHFERFTHDPGNSNTLSSNNVRFVHPDRNNVLWVATANGISLYNMSSGEFSSLRASENNSNSLISNNVRHIFEDRSGAFWISTAHGLSRFNQNSGLFTSYLHDPDDPASIGSNSIRKVYEDRRGQLWIATIHGGLNYFDRIERVFYSYKFDQANPHSLSYSSVRVISEDRSGILWIGTIGGGLNMYDPTTQRYRRYRHDPNNANSLRGSIVWSIAQGPDGDIWFATSYGVLTRYDRSTGRYTHLESIPTNHAENRQNDIRYLYWDKSGILWISSRFGGVDRYNPADESCINYRHDPENQNSLSNSTVIRCIYEDRSGGMWFCSLRGGLDHYDRETNRFTNFRNNPDDPNSLSNNYLISILQDSEGIYWVATQVGLNRCILAADSTGYAAAPPSFSTIENFYHEPDNSRSLSNSYVLCIHEATNGDLWFGTMQGLSGIRKEDRDDPAFVRYLMKNGLPNDVVYGILEDTHGNLWLSTNSGISRFNPRNESFKNYDVRDGLHGNEFNSGSYEKTVEGTFMFGGVDGASEFHPDSLSDNPFIAPNVITGFNIFDTPGRLAKSISYTNEITLSYKDNYFSFEFASLDFSKPDRNLYAYLLEGLDRNWTSSGNRRFAGYTHVAPGEYIFKVKGTNGDGVWNDAYTSVRIIITPPFWKTWWFILFLTLATGGGVASIITYRVRQLLKFERLRSKIAADLHDDIGAGLTEISIMGEVIAQKLPESSQKLIVQEIRNIGWTSRNLITSMSDIVWLVNPRRDSLYDLISRLGDSYKETLTSRDIHFKTQNLESLRRVHLSMEYRQHLLLIFKEAINNSLKYSECTEMSLGVALKGKKLTMKLIDNGKGFDTRQTSSGNGLKNMKDRAKHIRGALTIASTVGKGTIIEFEGNLA